MADRFVYFDLGKVLVHFDHQIAVEQLANLTQRSTAQVQQVVFDSDLQNRYETGLVTSQQFAAEINRELQCRVSAHEILEAISAIFQPNLEILEPIELLKSASVPLGILSNTCQAHWEWIMARRWPMFGDWFGPRILSYEVHSMKPDAGIYEACERHAGCPSSAIFFTDDRVENIAAAEQRGWSTCHFTSAESLTQKLRGWLAR